MVLIQGRSIATAPAIFGQRADEKAENAGRHWIELSVRYWPLRCRRLHVSPPGGSGYKGGEKRRKRAGYPGQGRFER